ncbi:hypothetical protein ACWNT8_13170 [Pigmentibacter ruber]|nr:hypothetical protein GTC16762_13630 [Pigmentibacter ruber]
MKTFFGDNKVKGKKLLLRVSALSAIAILNEINPRKYFSRFVKYIQTGVNVFTPNNSIILTAY